MTAAREKRSSRDWLLRRQRVDDNVGVRREFDLAAVAERNGVAADGFDLASVDTNNPALLIGATVGAPTHHAAGVAAVIGTAAHHAAGESAVVAVHVAVTPLVGAVARSCEGSDQEAEQGDYERTHDEEGRRAPAVRR